MANNKAFIFDTNFIIQNKNLNIVVSKLKDDFLVYVTQVSIEERIAQTCRELKDKYNKLPVLQKDYNKIAKIEVMKSYEELAEKYRIAIQAKYDKLFDTHVIPFPKTVELFSEVLERAYKKLPPFSNADNASDKGFKDSLIWLSMLSYFKDNGENTVLFVTGDNGFKGNADALCIEFKEATGKTLEIKDNSYFKNVIDAVSVEKEQPKQEKIPDIGLLRERIRTTIEELCVNQDVDMWGNPYWEKTFTISEKVDADYIKMIFNGLKSDISNHIFDESIPAYEILALDDRIINGSVDIPIVALENALKLYDDIKKKYPDFINQFFSTSANIFNQNYAEPLVFVSEDDELPF